MTRLIDADAVLKDLDDLKKSPWYHFDNPFVRQGMRECMEVVEEACIKDAPTVDAIPVEWIKQLIKKENIDIIHNVGVVDMVEQWKLHPIDFEISSEDAIPVKWLKDNYPTNGVYGTESYFRTAHAVQEVLKDWELEKEKRKEECRGE